MVGGKSNPKVDAAVESYCRELSNDPGNPPELKAYAAKFDVAYSTFYHRLKSNTRTHARAHTKRQALSPPEEKALVSLIRRFTLLGHPITYYTIREIAKLLREKRLMAAGVAENDIEPIGKNWPQRLRKRHPVLHTVWTKQMEKSRQKGSTREKLQRWFDELGAVRRWGRHLPCNIFNMDETGYGVGKGGRERVMVALEPEEKDLLDEARRAGDAPKQGQEWLTVLDCISATGREIDPLVILPGGIEYDPRNRPSDPSARLWSFQSTQSGWTNNHIGLQWLTNVFLPATKPSDPSQRRLLILDGQSSHTRHEFIYHCIINNVDLMLLPPHTSHKTQPLDVGVFSAIKRRLTYLTNNIHRFSFETLIPRRLWLELLVQARREGMTHRNIALGFRKSGIEPFDPSQVLSGRLPSPSPPPRNARALQATPSITESVLESLDSNISPVKRRSIEDSLDRLLEADANVSIMQFELGQYRTVKAKKARAGATVGGQETHIFTQEKVYEDIRARQVATAKKNEVEKVNKRKKALKKLQDEQAEHERRSGGGPSTIRGP